LRLGTTKPVESWWPRGPPDGAYDRWRGCCKGRIPEKQLMKQADGGVLKARRPASRAEALMYMQPATAKKRQKGVIAY